jgi:DNA mismatch repair ATPase MutS
MILGVDGNCNSIDKRIFVFLLLHVNQYKKFKTKIMAFIIDKQTLDDLNVFGKRGKNSIYGLFNTTRTRGGAQILEEMFLYPLSEVEKINKRSSIIRYFQENGMQFPFRGELFDTVEHYLSNTDSRTRLAPEEDTLQRKLKGAMGADADYEQLHKGTLAAIEIVNRLRTFIDGMKQSRDVEAYREEVEEMERLVKEPDFAPLFAENGAKKLPYAKTALLDSLIRFKLREQFRRLLYRIYNLDVYIAVALVATNHRFSFAKVLPGGNNTLRVKGMYHPEVKNAVANTLSVDRSNNVIFLTGANMAGKSTFMKTLGITVYLAHIGFPVPAESMEISVLEGMFTTINLPDNLNMGYSHFYAEVLRVKKVAEQLGRSKNLLVIFDELFRGTNVKDAYDATVAITKAFSGKRDCLFVISTHIIEAGDTLGGLCDNIHFVYFPTVMDGNVPGYTYTLTDGITSDRHGMMIINNEKVLDIIRRKNALSEDGKEPFIVDKQTVEDLNLLGEYRPNSIFNVFNRTHTRGGKQLLEGMFHRPLNDATAINDRVSILSFFQEKNPDYPIDDELFKTVDYYLSNNGGGNIAASFLYIARRKLMHYIGADKEYEIIHQGLTGTIRFLNLLKRFAEQLPVGLQVPTAYEKPLQEAKSFFKDKRLQWVSDVKENRSLKWLDVVRYDFILRASCREELRRLMQWFYETDAYLSIAEVSRERGFTYAKALPFEKGKNRIEIKNVYHPSIEKAIANSIVLTHDRNVLFLTGANMAGKSTLMKSFSIAVYLAHMGFPVAAEEMTFSVQDGIYTSINVADNLNMGYSHFYAEVLRVKQVATQVAAGKNLVIVFDELFKGTNVKDAYDASVAVTEAYADYENCSYIISTHIIEAGHTLKDRPALQFVFMPTVMKNGVPTYPYRLQEGITDDRHGMIIIQNEKIIDIITSK